MATGGLVTTEVVLWGRRIGVAAMAPGRTSASFQYAPDFQRSGIELAPFTMPLGNNVYTFPEIPFRTFRGLPGLLADSLPDRFGNALIDQWLARQGRTPDSFNALERLCYIGTRGMGALEFHPRIGPRPALSSRVDIDQLVELASDVLAHRGDLTGSFAGKDREKAVRDILRVGTSAGGARAKAVIAWNPTSNEVRSGQVDADDGFSYWLLKFDGVSANRDKELEDPKGYGAIEYAYHLMARAAGVRMNECRILEENGRRHFMTRRFDRLDGGGKLHMQSLCALRHFDFNSAGAHSYEEAFLTIQQLGMGVDTTEEQFRRMVFNVMARNQDDHVKNIAFLMDKSGNWSLSPAFDVIYSYNPDGDWTRSHQMTINGKRDAFTLADFEATARVARLRRGRWRTILDDVRAAVERWPDFAATAGVVPEQVEAIAKAHRLEFPAPQSDVR